MNWKENQVQIKLTLLVIIGIIGILMICLFTNAAFKSLRLAVKEFQYPDQKIRHLNNLLEQTNNSDLFLRLYTITRKKIYLKKYNTAVDSVQTLFTTYRVYIENDTFKSSQIDSIQNWWNTKTIENKELLKLNDEKPDILVIGKLMDETKDTTLFATKIYNEKVIRDSMVIIKKIPVSNDQRSGLLSKVKRAFGKKSDVSKEDSIAGSNMNIELFSYTYKKQDTLVTDTLVKLQSFSQDNRKKVKNVIRENLEFDTIYNLKRLAIIEKDFAIRDRISSQIKVIQAREQADAQDNISAIQNISAKTINKIFWIFLIILFACLCLYILLVLDAYRVKRYEERLILEKKNYQNLANNRAQFLSMMAHELRTPLQSIIGFSELLEETQKSSSNKSSQYSEIIKKSSSHLLQTINLLLDRSKIDAGKLELEHISFNLSECIHDVFESLSIQAGEKIISYVLQSDIPKDLIVYSDSFRLKQVLYNLLNNAIKFTHAGTVKLTCFFRHDQEDLVSIHFEVSDTGIGIAEHKLNHLFEEYNQLDKSTGRLFGGTGLGLVITKKILELFSSTLSVKSEAASGTSFLFDIDFTKSYSLPVKDISDIHLSGINILIVDDDSYNLLYTHQLLNNYSLSVTLASTIDEAIDRINETRPDVVLCDLYINESLGTELLAHIPEDTAVIFMSADHEHLNGLKEQRYHTLAKPFTIDALLSELHGLSIAVKKSDNIEIRTGTEFDVLHQQSLSEKLAALESALNAVDSEEIIYYLHQLKTTFGYLNRWEEIKMIQKTESSYTLYAKEEDLFKDVSNMLVSWNKPYSN